MDNIYKTDVLVIGSGLSGLLATIKLLEAGASVVLASKGPLSESNTSYAQGGIAASLRSSGFDSPALHLEDTINAGGGLVNSLVARQIIFEAPFLINELQRNGVDFDIDKDGQLSLAREGGHSQPRIVHNDDATGISVTEKLINRIRSFDQSAEAEKTAAKTSRLQILENAFAKALLSDDATCFGARFDIDGQAINVVAQQTILATGGLGQVFSRTTNPGVATGDGIALAYRAGARLVDMEFVQFHPTALSLDNAPVFLISEAVRGAGARLLDRSGSPFMNRFHKDGELATRDIVSRAINSVMESQKSTHVLLDLRPMGQNALLKKFPNIVSTVREFGIDPVNEPVPVSPAAHYFMGGIMTDPFGQTSLPGLYAIGECASVGLHGANRLASNSLLEAGVMALRAASSIVSCRSTEISRPAKIKKGMRSLLLDVAKDVPKLREVMYAKVGLIRSKTSLEDCLNFLNSNLTTVLTDSRQAIQAANVQLIARLITRSALLRSESRGAHFREDFPLSNDLIFGKRLIISQQNYDWMLVDNQCEAMSTAAARQVLNISA